MTVPTAPPRGGPSAPPPQPPPSPAPSTRLRRRTRPVGWGLALIGLGVVWLLSLAGVPIRWELVLPGALVLVGLLVLSVRRRDAGDGLIGIGIVLAVIALLVPVMPGSAATAAGERVHTITDTRELQPAYSLGAGSLTLDLREARLVGDEVTAVSAQIGFGELIVRVPAEVAVTGDARVGVGEATAFGRSRGGVVPNMSLTEPGTADGPVLDLDLQVGFGRIEVTR